MTTKSIEHKNPERNKITDQSRNSVSMIKTNSLDFIFVSFRICVQDPELHSRGLFEVDTCVGNTEGGGVWRVDGVRCAVYVLKKYKTIRVRIQTSMIRYSKYYGTSEGFIDTYIVPLINEKLRYHTVHIEVTLLVSYR